MKRWALIENNTVSAVVEQESSPAIIGEWVEITNESVGPGFLFNDGVFSQKQEKTSRIVTKIEMLTKRMTLQEFSGILTAAKTDAQVEAWKYVFDCASEVDLDSDNTKNGIAMFVAKGLISPERGEEILSLPI